MARKWFVIFVGLFAMIIVYAQETFENKDGINYTNVPITGTCGFVLGEILSENVVKTVFKGNIRIVDGLTAYLGVSIPEGHAFKSCHIFTTPQTKKIAKLNVFFGSDDNEDVAEFRKELYKVMAEKYGNFTIEKKAYNSVSMETVIIIDKQNPKRKIRIRSEIMKNSKVGRDSVSIEYFDLDLMKSEKKIDIKSI